MAGTVTVEEVLAVANGNTGRVRLIIDAMLRALQTNLPAVLEECGLPAVNGYFWAGEIIGDGNYPAISVAGSTTKEAHGTGYTNRTHLVCACVFPLPISRRDWQMSADVADLITAVMFCPVFRMHTGQWTPEGVDAWRKTTDRPLISLPGQRIWGQMQSAACIDLPLSVDQGN